VALVATLMPIAEHALDDDDHLAVHIARGMLLAFTIAFVLLGTQYHKLDIERGRGFLTWAWGPWCYLAATLCALCAIRVRRATLAIGAAIACISIWLARIIGVCVAMASGIETDTVARIAVVLYGLLALLFVYVFYGVLRLVGKRRGYRLAEQAAAAREKQDGD